MVIIFILGIILALAPVQYIVCIRAKKEITKFVPAIVLLVLCCGPAFASFFTDGWGAIVLFLVCLCFAGMLISDCVGWAIYLFSSKTAKKVQEKTGKAAKLLFALIAILIFVSLFTISVVSV